jgi:hypothetical protein
MVWRQGLQAHRVAQVRSDRWRGSRAGVAVPVLDGMPDVLRHWAGVVVVTAALAARRAASSKARRREGACPVSYGRVWEWVVYQEAGNTPVGVSMTRHGAMEALSLTLITVKARSSGRVVPVELVDGAYGFSYLRFDPALTADCERGVIRWHWAAGMSKAV